MSEELALVSQPLSAVDVRAQVNLIQEVMQSVMKDGTHFGLIPGAGTKPTLLKAGAEKLASTFRLAIDPVVEELSYGDEFRVRVVARVTEMGTGRFLGAGVGECSSAESKYQWRAVVCDEEWDGTPENLRRVKWNKGYPNKPAWIQKQVRMNVADVANTVLKMAKKRAMVDGILTVTGASDIFTQDIEELPKEYLDQKATPASVTPNPTSASTPARTVDAGTPASTQSSGAESTTQSSAISHDPGEPDIRPRSQKQAQTIDRTAEASPFAPQTQERAPQGQVTGPEPPITEKQRKMLFAISKSAGLSDQDVKDTLAGIGLTCHRDDIPKGRFQDVLDAVDPQFKFHTRKD
jgi:hypothetical protein